MRCLIVGGDEKGVLMNKTLKPTGEFIVGWNDILGFERVLEQVPPSYLEEVIVSRLNDVRDNVVGRTLAETAEHEDVKAVISMIEMRVISDTLAVICPVTVPAWPSWLSFFIYSTTLHASMFDIGMPLRGAVSCGHLCVRDWGVFGASVVRAHRVCESLDISACVFLSDVVDAINAAFSAPEARPWQGMFCEWYDVPMHPMGKTERHLVQLLNKGFFLSSEAAAIRGYVCEKFSAHGKSIDTPSVQRKMGHTISLLQWNRWLWEHGRPGEMLTAMQRDAADRARPDRHTTGARE
jgi:hypothetical protein